MRTVRHRKEKVENMEIEYMLLEHRYMGRQAFSIVCRSGSESETLFDVTSERDRALELFDAFVKGGVTPYAAREQMEELLS